MVRCGAVRCGAVRYGMVWYGMIWSGMVLHCSHCCCHSCIFFSLLTAYCFSSSFRPCDHWGLGLIHYQQEEAVNKREESWIAWKLKKHKTAQAEKSGFFVPSTPTRSTPTHTPYSTHCSTQVLAVKGAVSPILPSAPKCPSRHFIFRRKHVCFG